LVFTGCADGSGGPTCCTNSTQCGEGQGDCDSDVDCAGNLKCGQGNGLGGNCDTSLGFPSDYDCCYDPKSDAECLAKGSNHTYINGICFFVAMDLFNYTDAMVNCQTQFGSNNTGKLFEPRDRSTNDQVIEFAKEMILPSTSEMHIGINDMATEGTWQYATGGDLVYTNWANGQPDNYGGNGQDCGHTTPDTTWNDGHCLNKLPSICEMI